MSIRCQAGKAATLVLTFLVAAGSWVAHASAQNVLWSENFDGLILGPNVDEGIADPTAFTHDPPSGWSVTNAPEMATGGIEEWRGWSFADPGFWSQVDGQRRGEFTVGQNVIAVADSDEFDDAANDVPPNGFSTFMTTPAIDLSSSNSSTLAFQLDSSWRPEGTQTATITASFDGGAPTEILRFESPTASPFHKDDNSTNDSLTVFFDKPAGASNVQFEFGYFDTRNNWWWAVDNLQLLDGDPSLRAVVDRDTGDITLFNRTGLDQDIKGYSVESKAGALDPTSWASVTGNLDADGDGSVDSDDRWIRFTDSAANTDISEGSLGTGTLAANTSLELGPTWLKYHEDEGDIRFRYINGAGDVQEGIVEFAGNGGNSFPFADLDFDNDVDAQDWQTFVAGVGGDVADATAAVRYRNSDLNADGRYTPADVILFRNAFEAANGAGAFAAIAGVPEPSTAALASILVGLVYAACRRRRLACSAVTSAVLGIGLALGAATTVTAQPFISVFSEDFESLPLGPNVEEALAGTEVWTDVPPNGWTVDRSGVPGWDNPPDNNGVQEWIGWSFANRDWWVAAAGDQQRSQFLRASGTVMVADPDEWDDAAHPDSGQNGWYNTDITTPAIAIDGLPADSVSLSFDSSWRDEFDTNFQQSGAIDVSFDGGAPVEILRWLSDPSSPDYKPANTNEFVRIPVNNPAGAQSMEVTFRMFDAGNDWWWALDNIDVAFEAEPLTLEVNTTTGEAQILASTTQGANFNISSYSITSESGSLNPGSGGGGGPVEGDYNENGTVEQADLDLVLLNWGASLNAPWVSGAVDQNELDGVLLNWGSMGNGTGGGDGWLAGNLAAQGTDSIGSGIGESWEVLTASEEQLFEAFLLGGTLFDGGHAESIGEAFVVRGTQDLEFLFSTVGGNEIQGNVVYVSGASAASGAIPEPSSIVMLGVLLAAGGMVLTYRRQRAMRFTGIHLAGVLTAATVALGTTASFADGLLLRNYNFESGSAGQTISFSADTEKANSLEDTDLFGIGATYEDLGGIGGTGLGASFGGSGDHLSSGSVNSPPGGSDAEFQDLTGLTDRGFQLQVYPNAAGSGTRQDIVMDTTQHGVFITPQDTWGFVYGGNEHDSGVAVDFDAWSHVHLASFNGPGATLYLNGEAIGGASGRYNTGEGGLFSNLDAVRLTVGANTGTDLDLGLNNFFNGILDDLKFSAYGTNGSFDAPYNFAVDNDAAAAALAGTDAADVNLDGTVSGDGTGPAAMDDVTAFVEGWMSRNVLPSGQLGGDLTTRSSGDLNFDGVTDIADWAILNLADPAAGAAALSVIGGAGVPEPSTIVLAIVGLLGVVLVRRRSN